MRDLLLNNFKWKAIALGLAIAVWFTIKFANWPAISGDPFSGNGRSTELELPVFVLAAPEDKRSFQITPSKVRVRCRARGGAFAQLPESGIVAFVNLVESASVPRSGRFREVLVHVPAGVEVLRIEPPGVSVVPSPVVLSPLPGPVAAHNLNKP